MSAYCHQHGVVTLTCGTWGNVFRFLPPLSISDALLDEAFDVVAEALAAGCRTDRASPAARDGWWSKITP